MGEPSGLRKWTLWVKHPSTVGETILHVETRDRLESEGGHVFVDGAFAEVVREERRGRPDAFFTTTEVTTSKDLGEKDVDCARRALEKLAEENGWTLIAEPRQGWAR